MYKQGLHHKGNIINSLWNGISPKKKNRINQGVDSEDKHNPIEEEEPPDFKGILCGVSFQVPSLHFTEHLKGCDKVEKGLKVLTENQEKVILLLKEDKGFPHISGHKGDENYSPTEESWHKVEKVSPGKGFIISAKGAYIEIDKGTMKIRKGNGKKEIGETVE